ncbi:CPK2 [Symbiodinium microadriaticum]|nr:CPK2 [Symbiodinium microadriaticum]
MDVNSINKGSFTVAVSAAFSEAECEELLRLAGPGEEALVSGNQGPGYFKEEVRVAKMYTVNPDDARFQWVFKRLWQIATETNRLHWKLGRLKFMEPLNLVSYTAAEDGDVNGHYDWHADLMPGAESEGRLLSLSVQLSRGSDYQGGALVVGTEESSRGLGDAVTFPSYMAHCVLPVSKGVRHALVAWVRGRVNSDLADAAQAAHRRAIADGSKSLKIERPAKRAQLAQAALGLQRIYGNHLLHIGRHREAADMLRAVAQQDPYSPGALNNLAVAEYQQGKLHAAIDALLYAVSLRPNDGEVRANLGRFFFLDGRLPLGTYHLATAVTLWHRSAIMLSLFCMTAYCSVCSAFWCCCLTALGWPKPRSRDDQEEASTDPDASEDHELATANVQDKKGPRHEAPSFEAVKAIDIGNMKNPTRFQREINIAQKLDHPNVVRLYETFRDARKAVCANQIYLVMELCTGGELFDRIVDEAPSGFDEAHAAKYIRQILSAICYLHAHRFAHRDVKPENFLFHDPSAESQLKIIDFGLACQFEPGVKMSTKAGTAYYVAPEVLKGGYDEKCDVWSAGVISFVLLCGFPPFAGDKDPEILKKVKTGTFEFRSPEWDPISQGPGDVRLKRGHSPEWVKMLQALQQFWISSSITLRSSFASIVETCLDAAHLPGAKNLITQMLTFDPSIRPTAEAEGRVAESVAQVQGRLSGFRAFSKLKKVALTALAQQLPDAADLKVGVLKGAHEYAEYASGTSMAEDLALKEAIVQQGLNPPKALEDVNSGQIILVAPEPEDPDAEDILQAIDCNGSGSLDYTEFLAATLDQKVYMQRDLSDVCWAAFRIFDLDGDGKITREELGKALTSFERRKIEKMIEEVDKDGDGAVDFEADLHKARGAGCIMLVVDGLPHVRNLQQKRRLSGSVSLPSAVRSDLLASAHERSRLIAERLQVRLLIVWAQFKRKVSVVLHTERWPERMADEDGDAVADLLDEALESAKKEALPEPKKDKKQDKKKEKAKEKEKEKKDKEKDADLNVAAETVTGRIGLGIAESGRVIGHVIGPRPKTEPKQKPKPKVQSSADSYDSFRRSTSKAPGEASQSQSKAEGKDRGRDKEKVEKDVRQCGNVCGVKDLRQPQHRQSEGKVVLQSLEQRQLRWDEMGDPSTTLPEWLKDMSKSDPKSVRPVPPGIDPSRFKIIRMEGVQIRALIGKGGETIKEIRLRSGADIKIDHLPSDPEGNVTIVGDVEKSSTEKSDMWLQAAPPAPPALGNYGSPGMAMGGPGQGPGPMGAPMQDYQCADNEVIVPADLAGPFH